MRLNRIVIFSVKDKKVKLDLQEEMRQIFKIIKILFSVGKKILVISLKALK